MAHSVQKMQTKCIDFYMQPFHCISLTNLLFQFVIPIKCSLQQQTVLRKQA